MPGLHNVNAKGFDLFIAVEELIATLNASKILDGANKTNTQAIIQLMEVEKILGTLGYGRLAEERA